MPEEYEEDPLYEPVSATVSVIMTTGKTEAPLRPQIRFVHSNVPAILYNHLNAAGVYEEERPDTPERV